MSDITTDKKEEKNEIADKEEAAKIKVEENKTAEPSEESSILAPASKNILGLEELPEEIQKRLDKRNAEKDQKTKSKAKKRKKKIPRKVNIGKAFIKATYNNTIVT